MNTDVDYVKRALYSGQSAARQPEILIRSTKHSQQNGQSEVFSPKHPVLVQNMRSSPSPQKELSLTQIQSQKFEQVAVTEEHGRLSLKSANDPRLNTIHHVSSGGKSSIAFVGAMTGGSNNGRQFVLANRTLQPTLVMPVTGQQSLFNQRVGAPNARVRGGKRLREASQTSNQYKGAKDLLGARASSTSKEIIIGIGAANRFRKGTSATVTRIQSKPQNSRSEIQSPSLQNYDAMLDDQFQIRDNLESRMDWNNATATN